jgi:hypothetical protein
MRIISDHPKGGGEMLESAQMSAEEAGELEMTRFTREFIIGVLTTPNGEIVKTEKRFLAKPQFSSQPAQWVTAGPLTKTPIAAPADDSEPSFPASPFSVVPEAKNGSTHYEIEVPLMNDKEEKLVRFFLTEDHKHWVSEDARMAFPVDPEDKYFRLPKEILGGYGKRDKGRGGRSGNNWMQRNSLQPKNNGKAA